MGGSRRGSLAQIAAALLAEGNITLVQISRSLDAETQLGTVEAFGVTVTRHTDRVCLSPASPPNPLAGESLRTRSHASLLLLGPLLARTGRAVLPLPGPTETGPRSVDLHLKGLAAMGARSQVRSGLLIMDAPRLLGADIFLDYPSLSATLSLILAAVGALGRTVIRHAAKDPEVVDLVSMLVRMGARIRGAGTDVITIDGASGLSGTEHRVGPDRGEAAFYLAAAMATGGKVSVVGIEPLHMLAVLAKLGEIGASVTTTDSQVSISVPDALTGTTIRALPYPGFPADIYPLLAPALSKASGTSVISDSISPDRMLCLSEMRRVGVKAVIEPGVAVLHGGCRLTGAPVRAEGPSSASALLLTLLASEGEGVLEGAHYLVKRYPRGAENLAALGARVSVVPASAKS